MLSQGQFFFNRQRVLVPTWNSIDRGFKFPLFVEEVFQFFISMSSLPFVDERRSIIREKILRRDLNKPLGRHKHYSVFHSTTFIAIRCDHSITEASSCVSIQLKPISTSCDNPQLIVGASYAGFYHEDTYDWKAALSRWYRAYVWITFSKVLIIRNHVETIDEFEFGHHVHRGAVLLLPSIHTWL